MAPGIDIRSVSTEAEREVFIRLPWRIHKGHRTWVPPLLSDERRLFDPARNPACAYCDVTLALFYRDGVPLGRIMGVVNRRHNTHVHQSVARFGCLECPNDREVAGGLLRYVEEWARVRGMTEVVGPMGLTDQDPEGYLVEGFEHEPTIATYANFPFMDELMTLCGYTKEADYVVYKVPVPPGIPEVYQRVIERAASGGHVHMLEFRRRSQLKPYARRILSLMNETFADLYGYVPLDEREMEEAGRRFLPIVDPRFVKFATVDGDDAGFVLAMPNLDAGLRRANGRLFPLGALRIIAASRRTRQLDLLVGGVRHRYRSYGLAVIGLAMILQSARNAGMEVIDSHLELETNFRMRAEMERLGGELVKRYRIYRRSLADAPPPGNHLRGGTFESAYAAL